MIIDRIENAFHYNALGDKIAQALEYIKTIDFTAIESGKHEIDGDNIFALISEYDTKDRSESKLEAHKKYIDVQFIVKGTELMGYAPLTNQKAATEYDDTNDYLFYEGDATYTKVEKDMFAIFFPTDLHQPCIKVDQSVAVKQGGG